MAIGWTANRDAPLAVRVAAGALAGLPFAVLGAGLGHRTLGASGAAWALGLQCGAGAVVGLALGISGRLIDAVADSLRTRASVDRRALGALVTAGLAILAIWPTASWAFSGERISRTGWKVGGPLLATLVFGIGAAATTLALDRAKRRAANGEWRWPAALTLAGAGVAVSAIAADSSLFVGLYTRLHTALEACAWLSVWSVVTVWLDVFVAARPRLRSATTGMAALGVAMAAATALVLGAGGTSVADLAGRFGAESYVGRTLRRIEDVEASLYNPTGALGITSETLRRQKLLAHYDIHDVALGEEWTRPNSAEPAPRPDDARRAQPLDVIVFYVDTLRRDVAASPAVMPNLASIARESVAFERAYATGSETATSLPGITSGRYGGKPGGAGDLVELARRAGREATLIIPRSAREYLTSKRPEFAFPETVEIADYDPGKKVWGYGADRPTAAAIVDRAIEVLRRPRTGPRLLWLFHYDQHNWQDLDAAHVNGLVERHPRAVLGQLDRRYLAVASSLDAELGRLDAALGELDRKRNTVLVFLSDHGESLGRGGFVAHSVYLWEELVRVPLLLRIPGIAPRRVNEPVSLVDLAPTLAPLFGASTGGYHGQDLLEPGPRRLPILFAAKAAGILVRVGALDASGSHKLVLPLDAARAEYYDLRASDPDQLVVGADGGLSASRLVATVVRSPLFPR